MALLAFFDANQLPVEQWELQGFGKVDRTAKERGKKRIRHERTNEADIEKFDVHLSKPPGLAAAPDSIRSVLDDEDFEQALDDEEMCKAAGIGAGLGGRVGFFSVQFLSRTKSYSMR